MNLNGLLIGSENPQRLRDYYTKLFGKPNWDEGGYFGWQLGAGSMSIGPHDQVKGKNNAPGRVIWNIETADVKGEFAKLKAAGATVVKEPTKWARKCRRYGSPRSRIPTTTTSSS